MSSPKVRQGGTAVLRKAKLFTHWDVTNVRRKRVPKGAEVEVVWITRDGDSRFYTVAWESDWTVTCSEDEIGSAEVLERLADL